LLENGSSISISHSGQSVAGSNIPPDGGCTLQIPL
jgi:hypothetical protein